MYIARFSYFVSPANRQRASEFIRREVDAAARVPLKARMLVPLTHGQGGPSLQFEVEVEVSTSLSSSEKAASSRTRRPPTGCAHSARS